MEAAARRRIGWGAIAVIALAALVLPGFAGAKVTWVVKGAGYGHGVGMSAWGAYGYGKRGTGHRKILRHYYTGVEVETTKRAPLVRVLLETSAGDVEFTRATKACGRRLNPSKTYRAHRNGSRIRLQSGSGASLGSCGKRLRAGGKGRIEIAGVGVYRGALSVVPAKGSSRSVYVVNQLRVNDYVQGSLPGELFPSWPKQTLRAFAVAIRSIALSTDVGGKGFDIYSDTRTQVYGGVKLETRRTNRAVQATRNQVVTYKGKVAQTTYFSASGGRTESGFLGAPEVPYLQSVKDPYDFHSPRHRWTFRFSQAEMSSRLGPYLKGKGTLRRIKVLKRGDSPRIDYARLIGSGGSARVRGDTIAAALGLYDRWAFFRKVRR